MPSNGPWTPDQRQSLPGTPQGGGTNGGVPPQEPGKKTSGCLKWGLIGLAVLVVLVVIAGIFGSSDEEEAVAVEEVTTSAAPTSESAAESEPEPEPSPDPEPEPELEVDPIQQQQDDLADAIRDKVNDAQVSFRDAQVDVTFPIADNLTRGFIISGGGF